MDTYLQELAAIEHYKKYPNLLPWVGPGYENAQNKLLVLGESHYLDEGSNYHHDPVRWYEGVDISQCTDRHWMHTANIIQNGLNNGWKEKSKLIYKNISKALIESAVTGFAVDEPFAEICYLNYFQRPAEKTGKSINVSEADARTSASVVTKVISILNPGLVVFSSTLAWRSATKSGLINLLKETGIKCARVPHAGMPWWNRSSKKYGGKTGKQYFIDFLRDAAIN
ncbi:hypothetical protein SAMN06297280_1531 [Arsukibacterium tuosuense]|uniref:Uncharacterized protein n=1 Tax=Arsukibacterium tuosuense TaxID=1323745 RepID=A0A285IP78_9GAMM|nr:hypothetical protein [Arsukibacterium tuosuense]SNY49754.1 hypothetical protein SAMN06297280_1531 [Arsukibacterium tuosuense]